jgi:flagellar basal-body rod protein FlgC
MNLFGMMDASGEAMHAERVRAEVVAANMANAETTRTATGGPYRRQHVIFAADSGDTKFLDSMSGASGGANAGLSPGSSLFPSGLGSSGLASSGSALLSLPSSGLGSTGSVAVAPGVHIAGVVEDPSPPLRRYDPGHPDAGPDGYVEYPDINPITEMVDLMGATRAYGMNSSAVQAEKGMIASALDIAKS